MAGSLGQHHADLHHGRPMHGGIAAGPFPAARLFLTIPCSAALSYHPSPLSPLCSRSGQGPHAADPARLVLEPVVSVAHGDSSTALDGGVVRSCVQAATAWQLQRPRFRVDSVIPWGCFVVSL